MDNDHPMKRSYYVDQMRTFINRQPHMPKNFDDLQLFHFVHSCFFDVEKAKATIEKFCILRASAPELFANRREEVPMIEAHSSIIAFGTYDISNNRKLFIWQINDPGFDVYNYVSDCKLFTLLFDVLLMSNVDMKNGVVILLDAKDVNYKFMKTLNLFMCKKNLKYQMETLPIRILELHIVNASPIVDKILSLFKPFLPKEILEIINIHQVSTNTIMNSLKADDLPSDYGGTLPPVKIKNQEMNDLKKKLGDAVMEEDLWAAIGKKDSDISMDNGSFRTLNVD